MSFSSWVAWKLSLVLRGIAVLEYPNTAALAVGIKSLYDQTVAFEGQRELTQYNTKVKYIPWQEQILMLFPGIGRVRAQILVKKYGSIANIFFCEGDDWPLKTPSWDEFFAGFTQWIDVQ